MSCHAARRSRWTAGALSGEITAPTLVRSSRSGMYQSHPASNAAQKMLPRFGSGSRRPPA
jgi:hypothetical protein